MLLNHMARLLGGRAIILIVAQEDLFQAGFLAGQVHDGMLRRRLDDPIQPTGHREAQRMPIGQRLRLIDARQSLESIERARPRRR